MAKRGKCGSKFRRRPKEEPKKPHIFLPQSTITFAQGWQRQLGQEIDINDQSAVARFLLQLEDLLSSKVTMENNRLFRVDRPRPARLPDGRRENIQILWHGSNCQNGPAIILDGFRTGWGGMFGSGIYIGTHGKALHYSKYKPPVRGLRSSVQHDPGSGTYKFIKVPVDESGSPGMILKVEVALGKVFDAHEAMHHLRQAPPGYDSVRGVAGVTHSWGGTLRSDEWCVYNPCQVSVLEVHLLG